MEKPDEEPKDLKNLMTKLHIKVIDTVKASYFKKD